MYGQTNRNAPADEEILETLSALIVELANQEQSQRINKEQSQGRKTPTRKTKQPRLNPYAAIERIYEKYRKTQEQLNRQRQENLLQESASTRTFRVANQKTLQIISRKPSRPLFQRTQDILNQRQFRMLNARLKKEEEKEQEVSNPPNDKKFNIKQFHQRTEHLENRKRENINMKKMELMKQIVAELRDKPEISNKSKIIIQRNKANLYKKPVIDRFEEYANRSLQKKSAQKKRLELSETPFSPNLTQKTRMLASQSIKEMNKNVFDRISQSPSSTCLKHEHLHYEKLIKTPKGKENKPMRIHTDINDVTFSTPRSMPKSSDRNTIRKSPILKKLEFDRNKRMMEDKQQKPHRVRFELPPGDKSSQRELREQQLKSLIYSNKEDVINFVKELILTERETRAGSMHLG